MKRTIIKVTFLFSLLFSLFLSPASPASAAGPDLNVSGITNPVAANGTYTWTGTYSGYDYWSRTVGATTYVLYNDTYAGAERYWNLDTDFNDEGSLAVLFYSSSPSTAPTPTGLSWSADIGAGSLLVETGTPSAEISILGNEYPVSDGSTTITSRNFTNIGAANLTGETASRTFTIKNSGSAALTLSGSSPYIVISGSNASNFSVAQVPTQTLPASTGATTFQITFTPSFEGYHNAVVTIYNNDADEGEYTFNVQGYGYVARALLISGITDPSAVNGTYLHQGVLNNFQYWKHQTLNYYLYYDLYGGDGYWNIDNNTDDAASYFFRASESGTPVGLTGWTIDTSGDPDPTGSPVIDYAVSSPEINVQGNGASIPLNDTSPSFADHTKFGSIDFSSGSRTRTYTILNTGGEALTITGVTLGGSGAAEFSKTDPVLTTIPAYSNTTFTVTFDPSSEGTKTATITIANNDSDESSYSFALSGDAFSPKNLIVSDIVNPSDANGSYIYQGILNEFPYWKHESKDYYIFNGEYSSGYYWNMDVDTDDNDTDYLFFAASEAVAPVGLGGWVDNTNSGYETDGPPTIVYAGSEIDVRGSGSSIPDGSSTPTTTNDTDFSSVSVALASVSHTFTIYNTGFEALNLSGNPIVEISGTHAGDFTVTTQPTTPLSALTGTTTFTVQFDPSAGGTRSAMVSIANDDGDENPYNFSIQGTGMVAPTLTTAAAAGVSTSGATLGGTISSDGGDAVTERGVVYSSSNATPTIGGAGVTQNANGSGSGAFSEAISGLSLATHYDYQAYAINSQGTSYGGVQEFTTQNQISSITRTGATLTNASSVSWDVAFDAACTGLTASNFTLVNTGLTGPAITTVTGAGTAWTVTASTGTGSGTLGLNLTSATGLNAGFSNIPFSGEAYTIDRDVPTVTINQASGQSDPTNSSPIHFTVVFSKSVTGFTDEDVSLSGTAGATTAVVTGSGATYNVAVSGMTGAGTVIADIAADVAQDAAGNGNADSTSSDNQVAYDANRPGVTVSSTASNPTNTSPIPVTITFGESVTGFIPSTASGGLVITNATDSSPAGSGTTYTVDLTPSGQGEITVMVPENSAQDSSGNGSTESNSFSITYDSVKPTVTIEQASAQNDPTNASPIQFTVTFNEPVTDFETGDVTLGGTAGATTAAVTGSGAAYTVAVSGMTTNGNVTASLAEDVAQDAAFNTSEASTSSDNEVIYVIGPIDVTINQASGQSDPTNTLPVNFTVVFSRAIDPASFTPADVTLGGTAPGTLAAAISEIAPNDGTTFNVAVDGLTAPGTVTASLQADKVQDAAGNDNNASTSTDNTITYDSGMPAVSKTSLKPKLFPGPISFTVEFSEAVYDDPSGDSGTDDVTNPANYLLIEKGPNGVSERATCSAKPPAGSDDVVISVDRVVYDSATYTAAIEVNGGVSLPPGKYVLFVCGTTSIVDLAGNPINNGLSDFTYDFRVAAPSPASSESAESASIPLTGFAPKQRTALPMQPDSKAYMSTGMVLEIPALGVKETVVGVPEDTGWDVTWLGNQIGYLGGTAFPTWAGNSVLTGHATNANGGDGPFANLGSLSWGDQVVIHAFGQAYIYEVRTVNRWTNPKDIGVLTRHEDLPWVTLVTCNGYDEKTGTYRWRTVVRAVQIKVIDKN